MLGKGRGWRGYAKYPLMVQIFLVFITLSTLPMLFIEIHNYLYTQNIIRGSAADLIEAKAMEAADAIDNALARYEYILLNFLCDNAFLSDVRQLDSADSQKSTRAHANLMLQINRASYQERGIRSIVVTSARARQVSFDKYLMERGLDAVSLMRETERHSHSFLDNATLVVEHATTKDPGGAVFSLTKLLYDIYSDEPLGAISLYVDESLFKRVAGNIMSRGDSADRRTFVLDKSGVFFLDRDVEDPTGFLAEGRYETGAPFYGEIEGRSYLLYALPVTRADWTVVVGIDSGYITASVRKALQLYVLITAGSMMLIALVFLMLLSRTRRVIGKALDMMERVGRGQFDEWVYTSPQNEFTRIADGFNKMTGKITQLMNELQREKDMVREATRKEKNAEIQALEAQINPHFIYNTIDSINWRAIEKEEYEISDMLKKLASVLRYSINQSNRKVTVRQDMDWLSEYLFLQRYRFSESFRYEILVEEGIRECRIHKLLLQPIVENAVLHAFSGLDAGGVLLVTGERTPAGDLEFTVEDNGCGMTPGQVAALTSEEGVRPGSIGASNVLRRLRMYYGDRANVSVWSEQGVGTRVTLHMPDADAAPSS